MGRLELRLLGPPRVSIDGRESTLRTRKTFALLAYLAAEGGMHRRDKLAELLWPGSTSGRGRTTLRSALAGIRRELREGVPGAGDELLKIEGDLLGVTVGPELGLDLDVLREAFAASRASRRGEKYEGLISTLRSADAAYRGEFLEGFRLEDAPEFELWVEAQRTLWRARVGEVLGRLGELESETGELDAAAGTAQRWVARDPSEEAAHVRLMETRSAAGDPGGALDAYEEYRSELHDIGMDPGPGTETLHASIQTRAEADRAGRGRSAPGSLRMPFVGREAAFGALVEEYRAARSGQVRSVIVLGEAGIGKTRLAEEFLGWAASRGADVLRAKTSQTGSRQPYETLVDALRPRLERERAPDDLLEDRWLAELSRIMPELGDRYPDLPPPTSDEASSQAVLFEAVARLVAALAGSSSRQGGRSGEPLVAFGDDLQWADGASLDALRYACRSWARDGVPLLLLLTVREEGLRKGGLGGWLSSLERELAVRRLALTPMDEGNVHSLLRLIAGPTGPDGNGARREGLERVGRWLREESDGHPLFLAQILGVLLERGVLVERAGRNGRRGVVLPGEGFDEGELRGLVPAGLRELILDKLRPLPDDASDLLTAGAVLGRNFGFGELLRVAGVGETAGIAALDELVSARLVEEGGASSGGAYSFAHDKIRDVVYTEAGEARREVFHRRALEHLEDRGASTAELARHAVAAKLRAKAIHYLLGAAEEAMAVFAAGDAVGHYEQARDLLEDRSSANARGGDRVPGRQRLYGGLARACALVHDWARAQEAYEKLLAAARGTGDREAEWEALHGLGMLGIGFTVGSDDDELLRGVRRREQLREIVRTAGAAQEEHEGTKAAGAAYSPRAARRYAERALRLARELGREELILRSEFGLGVACGWTGMWKESAFHMEEALSFYATSGGGEMEPQNLIHLLWSKGLVAWGRGLVDGPVNAFGPTGVLQDYWREATTLSNGLDTDYARAQLGSQGVGLSWAGEYEDAIGKASRGLEASRSLGHAQFAYLSLEGLGDAYRGTFALEEAKSTYSDMFDWVTFTTLEGHIHAKLCSVAALSGEWERARGHALEAIGLGKEVLLPLSYVHRYHDIEALLRGGDTELARELFRSFERRVGRGRGCFRVAYLRSAAVFTRWNGDTEGTLFHLREAFGLAEKLELPGEIWQVGAALGETHENRGEIGPSGRAFGRAAVVVRQLAAKIPDGELRQGFLAAPQVRRVLEKSQAYGARPAPPVL